ncbi:PadR family transcriptional regulator [Planctomycetes bacterium TBK1r]|uniref:Transcriptional regulator PadR-like family protein n=1 Tax=Stieleria magnilauensis TaxID=2527963 RepID=A0ABX5XRL4_9BACT|nr:Transcriptional regulator PadR-like family protein [Planctomycetes bacterium TBK1r]
MASKQKTKFAVLGLLTWKPMSGYDIKKMVDVGLSHFWNENYGQIYPTLEQLVRDGMATKKEKRITGQRQRFVYAITRKGQRAFSDWLSEPTDAPIVRNELQLKFFLSCKLPADQSVRLINEYRAQQQGMLDEYRQSENVLRQAIRDETYPDDLSRIFEIANSSDKSRAVHCNIFLLTLRHGIHAIEARLAWCDEVLENLSR